MSDLTFFVIKNQKKWFFLYRKTTFSRLDTNNIEILHEDDNVIHQNKHDGIKADSVDDTFEKQVKDTLNSFDVQQQIGVSFNSVPGSLARMPSVIVPYKKSALFSTIPLVLY